MRPRRLPAALGLALVLALGALILAPAPLLQAQTQPPRGNQSGCGGTAGGALSADTIRACDPLSVTVKVAPSCPICPNGVNVVYVQLTAAFQGPWMVQESLASYDRLVNYARDASIRDRMRVQIGVVHYNQHLVRKALDMTDEIDAARGPLGQPRLGHDPFGDVVGAARTALEMLDDARRMAANVPENDHPCEFVVFFASTKSVYTWQGAAMRQAAQMIRSAGVKLFVGCPETVDDYCTYTEEMPAQGRYYTRANDRGKLNGMVEQHMDGLQNEAVTVRDLYLTQFLPDNLAYVPGSANVPPKAVNKTQDHRVRIDWEWKRIRSTQAQTITYAAQALAEGTGVVEGGAKLVDMNNKSRELPMPSRPITVTGLCAPPTATPTEIPTDVPIPSATPESNPTPTPVPTDTPVPTPTDTPVPTATLTPTATRTATPTPTPKPEPIYLPVMVWETCTEQSVYSDVVLAVDVSTSMNQGAGAGQSKLEATLGAARSFVALMDLTPDAAGRSDRVAVVGFNSLVWVETGLTRDADALRRAFEHLASGQREFTRLDLAFETGLTVLRPALGQPNTTPVLILLTDGRPNRVPPDPEDGTMETTVRKAAQRAKDAGARVYTIGIGASEEINAALMRQCATSPADFFYTPDPEALAGIYTQIAYSFGCSTGRHDWGRAWP